MGIKGLHKFLRGKCPELYQEVHLSSLRYSKVMVDFSLYLFKYITIFGNDGWMSAMINLISAFRRNDVHPIFVFDGVAPEEKKQEREERREKRDKLDEKIFNLEQALDKARKTGEIDPILLDLCKDNESKKQKRLLSGISKPKTINLNDIAYEIERIKKQSVKLTAKEFEDARKIFELLGVPFLQAPLEGENLCADLCIRKEVDYVVTEDSDVFAYGCPILVSKINTATETCIVIKLDKILETLGLTQAEFLDFCIMCSCDYNTNIPGIGPERAFKLIQTHKTIEAVRDSTNLDVSMLKHERVRELFKTFAPFEKPVYYCRPPVWPEVEKFLFYNQVKINTQKLKRDFEETRVEFVIEDDPEFEAQMIEAVDKVESETAN